MIRQEIEQLIREAIEELKKEDKLGDLTIGEIPLEHPEKEEHGDYATPIALQLAKQLGKNPREIADLIISKFEIRNLEFLDGIKAEGPGFINFYIAKDYLLSELARVSEERERFGKNLSLKGKKMMVEYAHPNTHKEMHIGHMRTLITGEALARIFSFCGAKVFRANYQGDIGPHVVKAIWGTQKILGERKLTFAKVEKLSLIEKAHLLGEGYVRGNQEYEANKPEIDALNARLYKKERTVMPLYYKTRQWSLKYYDVIYKRFDAKFNKLYFESQVAKLGEQIVLKNIGKVFEQSEGAIIFDGEKHGLHKRVFITRDGNPTYEGKEMGLAFTQYKDFPFDLNCHVVANEQTGYFKVVFKALELVSKKFKGKEYHLPMGMVQLVGKKMSSRTGVVITVDGLLDDVKALLLPLIKSEALTKKQVDEIASVGTIAAVKYSVLKNDTRSNVAFDMAKSVSLDGDSGPYLQYTYARCRSILRKARIAKNKLRIAPNSQPLDQARDKPFDSTQGKQSAISNEEIAVLRWLYRFPEVVQEAGEKFSPNLVCNFVFELAQRYNYFYNIHSVLQAETEEQKQFRLLLTSATAQTIKNSLNLLGIKAPEKM
ncbi:MAG: arginine--tRNA ligase [Candidatus Wildermuthbacteria bacterium]|nr:arginine--tRNA ligase [Candidatus Wildermuthbacteria bacterium]